MKSVRTFLFDLPAIALIVGWFLLIGVILLLSPRARQALNGGSLE